MESQTGTFVHQSKPNLLSIPVHNRGGNDNVAAFADAQRRADLHNDWGEDDRPYRVRHERAHKARKRRKCDLRTQQETFK